MNAHRLSESLEDYLEAIYRLEQKHGLARVKDIAAALGVAMGSVTGSLKVLTERGLIDYEPYSKITLTNMGRRVAHDVDRRHAILKRFFTDVLKVDLDVADETACRVEHVVPSTVMERFLSFIECLEECPGGGYEWINGAFICEDSGLREGCARCRRADGRVEKK